MRNRGVSSGLSRSPTVNTHSAKSRHVTTTSQAGTLAFTTLLLAQGLPAQTGRSTGLPATERTLVRILCDATNLYLSAICYQSAPTTSRSLAWSGTTRPSTATSPESRWTLNVQTEPLQENPTENFSVVHLRRRVTGNSNIGFMFGNRDPGPHLDLRLKIDMIYGY